MARYSRDVLRLNPELQADAALRRAATGQPEDMADRLLAELRLHAPDLARRLVRDLPFRTFRVDLADPETRLAIEVNGGLQRAGGGKHATARDHVKVRELTLAGWRVLVFTSGEVRADPLGCIAYIRRGIEG